MTVRRSLIVLLSSAVVLAGSIRFANWSQCGLFYNCPSPARISVCFRDYDPMLALAPLSPYPQQKSDGFSNSAGKQFVTNTRDTEISFAIPPQKSTLVIPMLADGLTSKLSHDGGEILSRTGDPIHGIRLAYRQGQNIGSATFTLAPPDRWIPQYTESGLSVLPPYGTAYMVAKIRTSERWYPTPAPALQARLQAIR